MSTDEILDFYENLGFEEAEIEENLIVLGIELGDDGDYALLTDADGAMPTSLKQEVIFAYYDADDSFQWSASFKNSQVFESLWNSAVESEDKLKAIKKHRENNMA